MIAIEKERSLYLFSFASITILDMRYYGCLSKNITKKERMGMTTKFLSINHKISTQETVSLLN